MNEDEYFFIMDYLFQKYEIKYEENMSPEKVIEGAQELLFPNERSKDLIHKKSDKRHNKLQLFRSKYPDYIGAAPATEKITREDIQNYQFYLFRPLMNVFMTVYVIHDDNFHGDENPIPFNKNGIVMKFEIIYTVKKTILLLKKYIKSTLIKRSEALKDDLEKGFIFRQADDLKFEYKDDQYVEHEMNDKEFFLIINKNRDNRQTLCSDGRFYYFSFGESQNNQQNSIFGITSSKDSSKENYETLDYDQKGLKLDDVKKKLKEKHQYQNTPDDKVIILFNGKVQTENDQLHDLLSDNHFYPFTVIFESSDMKLNPLPPQKDPGSHKKLIRLKDRNSPSVLVPIPEGGRPLIISLEDYSNNFDYNNIKYFAFNKNNENEQLINIGGDEEEENIIDENEKEVDGAANFDQINISLDESEDEKLINTFLKYTKMFFDEEIKSKETLKSPQPSYISNINDKELFARFLEYYDRFLKSKK